MENRIFCKENLFLLAGSQKLHHTSVEAVPVPHLEKKPHKVRDNYYTACKWAGENISITPEVSQLKCRRV